MIWWLFPTLLAVLMFGYLVGRVNGYHHTMKRQPTPPYLDCRCGHMMNAHKSGPGGRFMGACTCIGSKPNTSCACEGYLPKQPKVPAIEW